MAASPEQLKKVETIVKGHPLVIFMKGDLTAPRCGFSAAAADVLKQYGQPFSVNVLEDDALWGALEEYTQWPTVPQIFVHGEFVGGCDLTVELHKKGELKKLIAKKS